MADLNEIKTKIRGEFKDDAATLEKYSRDAGIFEVRPEAVIYPKGVDDVKNLFCCLSCALSCESFRMLPNPFR